MCLRRFVWRVGEMHYYNLDMNNYSYVVESEKSIENFVKQSWIVVKGGSAFNMAHVRRIFEITEQESNVRDYQREELSV